MILSGLSLIMIIASIPALIIAAAGHEYAHAKAADLLGDPTPRMMGRLTMNPFVHLDLIGSLALIIGGFGWAKPVVVNPTNFKDPRTDDMIVSIAGPMANLVMAFIGYVVMRIYYINTEYIVAATIDQIKLRCFVKVVSFCTVSTVWHFWVIFQTVPVSSASYGTN